MVFIHMLLITFLKKSVINNELYRPSYDEIIQKIV